MVFSPIMSCNTSNPLLLCASFVSLMNSLVTPAWGPVPNGNQVASRRRVGFPLVSRPSSVYQETTTEVEKATRKINALNDLHSKVTKYYSMRALCTVSWVLHSLPIKVRVEPLSYMEDWGVVQLDLKQIDMKTFPGNKIFIGTSFFPFLFPLFSLPPQTFY